MLAYTRCTRDVVFSGPLRQTQTSRMHLWQKAAYKTHEDHERIQNVYVENHPIEYSTILYTRFCKAWYIENLGTETQVQTTCVGSLFVQLCDP